MELSIVLPCYNESKNIPFILKRFAKFSGQYFELILVNNGSTDNSQNVIDKELKKYKFARCVIVRKNIGYGNGIFQGLKAAKADAMAFTHADMQCDPKDVFRAFDILKKNGNVLVKGQRVNRFSILTSGLHVFAAMLFLRRFNDINGQPKVFRRELFEKLTNPPKDFNFDLYVQHKAVKSGIRLISIPVAFHPRKFGVSSWAGLRARLKTIWSFFSYVVKLRIFDY